MKKILSINSTTTGSTGRIMCQISRKARENGFDSYISYGRGENKTEEKGIKIGDKKNIAIHGIGTRLFDKHGFYSKKVTKDFLKKVDKINPDIIHLHNIHGYYIDIELLFEYIKEKNIPIVWTLHDCWSFTGHCAHFEYVGCDKWKNGCEKCPQKNSYPKSIFKDNSKSNYERKKKAFLGVRNVTLVTPSKWLQKLVKESFLKDYEVKVINNGIDLDVFKPSKVDKKEFGIRNDKFVILGVASKFIERKGFKYFLELSKLIENDMVIYLVGLSKKQIKHLPDNIIGIEKTENIEELVKIYSIADVLVNPTLEENFPTVNLEALACGTPVITFDTGGSPETIDNKCGFLIEKGNVKEVLNKVNLIKKNGKDAYKKECVKRTKTFFCKEDKFKEYIDLYNKILNEIINGDKK